MYDADEMEEYDYYGEEEEVEGRDDEMDEDDHNKEVQSKDFPFSATITYLDTSRRTNKCGIPYSLHIS